MSTNRSNGYATLSAERNPSTSLAMYRYELGGDIGVQEPLLVSVRELKVILWIMLNPSTADANEDDQTIATIARFSTRWGYNHLLVGNLYAYRTKHPKIMFSAMKAGIDIVGPHNDIWLRRMVVRARASGGDVMAAWGVNAKPDRVKEVQAIAGEMKCLKVNGDGSPIHPLYQPNDLVPTVWQGMAA